METENVFESKSISCTKLPESFFIDKQEAKKFFSQFGSIRRFILYPSKYECVVEYDTTESAQRALNAKVNFVISPARQSPKSEYFVDPDVQSELESMLPHGSKPPSPIRMQQMPIENYIKNPPQSFFKTSKTFTNVKSKTEPLTIQTAPTDPRQLQIARNELEALCRKPARTAEEKFAILDSRDKLYRVINARTADIKNVESTKGTCKDMCPEKERVMRVARLQVSSFELDDDGEFMDPMRAIKQYSRSSADQEIPLPHELRSDSVLKSTMAYLLHNVMNLCDDDNTSLGDWFHFIWDRTRGIRKDITQQELCSPTSVELLEQCVRFHIHCSGRLIAEDPSVFDRKINDENLTKSLQTLKYMYDDLKVRNIKCPNEAEFRAYVILLNLNESGNFLWEIKRLEKDILNSQEIRFALEVYFAVSLSNYVKFFNLVREATYMNACILLRYFTQIRLKALFTIIRSYISRRGQGLNFSISYLTEILAFEDDDAAVNFLSYHRATCDKESDNVNLDSRTFGSAETPFQMERSIEIVESKMERSIAEAICGSYLPDAECFQKIVPHSSFDNRGFLKKEAFYAEDQNGPVKGFKVPMESPPVSPGRNNYQQQKPKPDQPTDHSNVFGKNPFGGNFSQQQTKTTNSIFGTAKLPTRNNDALEVPSVFSKPFEPSNPFMYSKPAASIPISAPKVFGAVSFGTSSPPMQQSTLPPNSGFSFQQLMQKSLQEKQEEERKRLLEEQRKKLEEDERKTLIALEKLKKHKEELLRLKVEEKKRREEAEQIKIEEENRREELKQMHKKKLNDDAEKMLNALIGEIVEAEVRTEANIAVKLFVEIPQGFYEAIEHDIVVEEIFKIYNQEMTIYINSVRDKYRTLLTILKGWRSTTIQQIEKRKKLSNIGCTMHNQSIEEIANDLHHPQQQAALSNMKVYISGRSQQIKLPDLDVYRKINLFKEMKLAVLTPLRKFFWKILISVPLLNQEKCAGFSSFIRKWLTRTFDVKENEEIFYLQSHLMQQSSTMASICMRKLQGDNSLNETGQVNSIDTVINSNSLLFMCTTSNLLMSRKRLQNILKNLDHPIAVSIIIYKNLVDVNDEVLIAQHMNIGAETNVIDFEINIFYECHDKMKDLTEVVLESCQFLCDAHVNQLQRKDSKILDLEMQHIHDFLQFCVGDEMWQRIEVSCRDSKEFNNHVRSFNSIINIYNLCIDKLIEIVKKDFSKLPSFPKEFLNKLPPLEARIPNGFEYFPQNWKSTENQKNLTALLNDLKMKRMLDDDFRDFNDLKDKMKIFLQSNMPAQQDDHIFNAVIEKVINGFYRLQLQLNDFSNDLVSHCLQNLRWLDIFGVIVVGKFNEVQKHHKNLPSFVIYEKSDLRKYCIPWWYKIKFPKSKSNDDHSSGPQKKKPKVFPSFNPTEIQAILMKGAESTKKMDNIINKSKENVTQPRVESTSFDRYLYNCEEKFRNMKDSLDTLLLHEN